MLALKPKCFQSFTCDLQRIRVCSGSAPDLQHHEAGSLLTWLCHQGDWKALPPRPFLGNEKTADLGALTASLSDCTRTQRLFDFGSEASLSEMWMFLRSKISTDSSKPCSSRLLWLHSSKVISEIKDLFFLQYLSEQLIHSDSGPHTSYKMWVKDYFKATEQLKTLLFSISEAGWLVSRCHLHLFYMNSPGLTELLTSTAQWVLLC